jgi:hypothetical protein
MDVCQDAAIVKSVINHVRTTMEAIALKRRLVPPRFRPSRLRRRPLWVLPLRGGRCHLSIICKLSPRLRLQVARRDLQDLQKRSISITRQGVIRSSSHRLMEPLMRQCPPPKCFRHRREGHQESPVDPPHRIGYRLSLINQGARAGTAPLLGQEVDQEAGGWGTYTDTGMAERARRHLHRSLV